MENFVFQCTTKVIFGRGTESNVGKEVKKHTSKILLHYGSGSIKKYGLYDTVIKSLEEEGIKIIELSGVKPNPRLSLVKEGIKICRENKIDFILAVGGGSVIDSAKAISIGVPYSGDVWDFFSGKAEARKSLPVGVILTIPAAGSEASKYLVITNEEGWHKKVYFNEIIRPKFAILNPELTFTLPPYQTAAGAVDIISHVMERYFTEVQHVDLTDRLCEATLKTVIKNTPIVLREPDNYNARAEIMWAGTIAHNDLLDTGRIKDFGSHRIENVISGIYDVTHGAGLSVIFPAWMKYVYKYNVERFAQFAVRVWNVDPCFESLEELALEGIKRLVNFFKEISLPTTLEELNISDERFDEIASRCTELGPVGNLKKLYKNDVVSILKLAQK